MPIRDADRFKEKIEVSLDSRQIFFLFFGGAVIAGLVFVLGVMVGKRLEARDRVLETADTSAMIDPLAALDELARDEKMEELTFQAALSGKGEPKPLGDVELAPDVVPEPAAPPPKAAPAEKKPAAKDEAKDEAKPEAKPEAKDEGKQEGKPKFTLQLSSFQDRAEADAFVAKLKAAGYQPYVIKSDIEDKGLFYRVRLGKYPSWEDALEAKADFEKRQHIIAYVTRL